MAPRNFPLGTLSTPDRRHQSLLQLFETLEVEDIAALPDPILRNYFITLGYYHLGQQLMEHLGRENLVWPAFGSWASSQVGRYLRLEAIPMRSLLPRALIHPYIELLGDGNQLIFRDIATPFRDYLRLREQTGDELDDLARRDPTQLSAHLQQTLDLDPRPLQESDEGQRLMIIAFEQYTLAGVTDDPDARAERIFVANCCVGLQEQARVDAIIDQILILEPLNHLIDTLPLERLTTRLLALPRLLPGLSPQLAASLTDLLQLLHAALGEGKLTQIVGTQLLLRLQMVGDNFWLGADVPWMSEHQAYPQHLARFDLDDSDHHFARRLAQVLSMDKTPDGTQDSAAEDWSDLDERMGFILELFRTRQQDPRLHADPLGQELRG